MKNVISILILSVGLSFKTFTTFVMALRPLRFIVSVPALKVILFAFSLSSSCGAFFGTSELVDSIVSVGVFIVSFLGVGVSTFGAAGGVIVFDSVLKRLRMCCNA